MMALRDTQQVAGPCVKTGRGQKLKLNLLIAEAAAKVDDDDPSARGLAHWPFSTSELRSAEGRVDAIRRPPEM
jgi:hypothetical protein